MAAAVTAGSVAIDFTAQNFIVTGSVALSGNYGTSASHGDTLDLSVTGVPSGAAPSWCVFSERPAANVAGSGWVLRFAPGTTQKNGVIQAFGSGTSGQGLAEYTAGNPYASATPAIPTTVYFVAVFPKV